MVTESIGTILQILVFTLIAFLVFVIQKRTVKGFLDYVGLKKSTRKANFLAVVACLIFAAPPIILTLVSADYKDIMFDPNSITGKIQTDGVNNQFNIANAYDCFV